MAVPSRPSATPAPTSRARVVGDERALARYLRRTVYPYSDHYRRLLTGAHSGGRADFERLPPTDLAEVPEPAALVLRPDLARIVRHGERTFAARTAVAKTTGGMHRFNRKVVEHRFKPVHWVLADGVPIGYSAADLARLAGLGERWLERAGVRRSDVVVSLLPGGPQIPHWQLAFGARRAGVSAIHLDPNSGVDTVSGFVPSVLVGDAQHLVGFFAQLADRGLRSPRLRTVIAVGDPLSGDLRGRLSELAGGVPVVGAWVPPGVRAVWSECHQGAAAPTPAGYHLWDGDVVEVAAGPDGSGEVLWTGVGWRGSAVVRLRTFATAFVETLPCPACGSRQPRIVPLAPVVRPGTAVAGASADMAEAGASAGVAVAGASAGMAVAGASAGITVAGPSRAEPMSPAPLARPAPSLATAGAEAILDAETEVAAWQVEYRTVAGQPETIVVLAPAWGAATVPLIRRLDRHLRATQFVVLERDEIAARIERAGGLRVVGERVEAS